MTIKIIIVEVSLKLSIDIIPNLSNRKSVATERVAPKANPASIAPILLKIDLFITYYFKVSTKIEKANV